MSITLQQFVESILRGGLLPDDEVRACIDRLAADDKPRDTDALAELMIARGLLTRFQVRCICQGQRLVLGSYVLLEPLGQGGMGTVYRARHGLMNRVVALKVLRGRGIASERMIGTVPT